VRIISGTLKGRIFNPPKNLPARPTTDFAKTGLFNILNNLYEFNGLKTLDLFGGTGNISIEFISRGVSEACYVELNSNCVKFISQEKTKLGINNLHIHKKDVFSFLKASGEKFDIIFADPPYDTNDAIKVAEEVFQLSLVKENGMLIVEHSSRQKLDSHKYFKQTRKYGNVHFSFFHEF
jgi:16S rRNA (guanine966-N2)-methyltransferase